jgi:hypothetical protein
MAAQVVEVSGAAHVADTAARARRRAAGRALAVSGDAQLSRLTGEAETTLAAAGPDRGPGSTLAVGQHASSRARGLAAEDATPLRGTAYVAGRTIAPAGCLLVSKETPALDVAAARAGVTTTPGIRGRHHGATRQKVAHQHCPRSRSHAGRLWTTSVRATSADARLGSRAAGPSGAPVHRHHARAAEAQVVLQRHLRVGHLALARGAAQVPHQLGTLREARRAKRVPLREQAA